jgi:hypothetical protein
MCGTGYEPESASFEKRICSLIYLSSLAAETRCTAAENHSLNFAIVINLFEHDVYHMPIHSFQFHIQGIVLILISFSLLFLICCIKKGAAAK